MHRSCRGCSIFGEGSKTSHCRHPASAVGSGFENRELKERVSMRGCVMI